MIHEYGKDLIVHTVCCSFRHRLLAPSTSDPNSVDHVSLFCFVSEATSLVGARGTGGAVYNI